MRVLGRAAHRAASADGQGARELGGHALDPRVLERDQVLLELECGLADIEPLAARLLELSAQRDRTLGGRESRPRDGERFAQQAEAFAGGFGCGHPVTKSADLAGERCVPVGVADGRRLETGELFVEVGASDVDLAQPCGEGYGSASGRCSRSERRRAACRGRSRARWPRLGG